MSQSDQESLPADAIVVFLDFDGVLHSANDGFDAYLEALQSVQGGFLFRMAPALAEVLEPFHEAVIVVSSSWRRLVPLSELKQLLGPLGKRVIGTTAIQNHGIVSRCMEIFEWVSRERPARWIALDDDDVGWPADQRKQLIHCDGQVGLTASDMTRLKTRLRALRERA